VGAVADAAVAFVIVVVGCSSLSLFGAATEATTTMGAPPPAGLTNCDCFLRACSLASSRANRSTLSALVSPASFRPWNSTDSTLLCGSIASAFHTASSSSYSSEFYSLLTVPL